MDIAHSLGATSRSSKLVGAVSKLDARSPFASSSHTSVRFPLLAARSPSPAVIVVLPTPPLPVTNRSLRSSSSATQLSTPVKPPPHTAASDGRPETHAARLCATVQLYVSQFGGGDPDTPPPFVGEPEHPRRLGDGRVDLGDQFVGAGIVRQLDFDLPGRLSNADPDVHVALLLSRQ